MSERPKRERPVFRMDGSVMTCPTEYYAVFAADTYMDELEAEVNRLLGQPGRQHTISYLEDLKAENKRLLRVMHDVMETCEIHPDGIDGRSALYCFIAALEGKR